MREWVDGIIERYEVKEDINDVLRKIKVYNAQLELLDKYEKYLERKKQAGQDLERVKDYCKKEKDMLKTLLEIECKARARDKLYSTFKDFIDEQM